MRRRASPRTDPLVERIAEIAEHDSTGSKPGLRLRERFARSRARQRQLDPREGGPSAAETTRGSDADDVSGSRPR
jgi:hypothetical protein